MLKKFGLWFICFGLSFLVENFGWTEQGKAFMYIDLGVLGIIILIFIFICLFDESDLAERLGISILAIILYSVMIGIVLIATWIATKLFNINFYVAYQIMTFGQCLCFNSKKED